MDMKSIFHLAAVVLAVATTSAAAQTKLLLSTFFPPTHPIVAEVLVPWGKEIGAATQGRVTVEMASASLAPPPGQLDMVQKGIADIALQFAGVVPNRLQPELVTEIPGAVGSAGAMSKALWATHERYFAKDDKRYKGVHLLGLVVFPTQEFFCVKACPTSVDQLKSAKLATTPGTPARQYGALTSGVVAGPAVRYFEVVSKGIVDAYAAVTPIEAIGFNLAPSTTGILKMKDLGTAGSFALVVNPRKWAEISEVDRKAITDLSGASFSARMATLDAANAIALKKLADGGVKTLEASAQFDADLKKAYAFLAVDWLKEVGNRGIDGAAALKFYRDQIVATGK